ncbi:MAG: ABC transporter permease subunit, partial [Kiritimatiellales bacterium]|nr:ABC transporter permease subunit [Kiritimatiellales bacterium]
MSEGKRKSDSYRAKSDIPFIIGLCLLSGIYIFLIVGMLAADAAYLSPQEFLHVFQSPEIRYATRLSLISSSLTTILSLWVAVPIGYLLSRFNFRGRSLLDAILDIPIVLPPLVIGLSLLIFFQTGLGKAIEKVVPVTYAIPSVILAQFMVACAFAVRTMRSTFDQINPRREDVARTLGCTRSQAFW